MTNTDDPVCQVLTGNSGSSAKFVGKIPITKIAKRMMQ
jgi:hypothetical protein